MKIDWLTDCRSLHFGDFEIINILGSGGFGTCYEAKYKHVTVCVKKLDRTSKKKAALQSFQAETRDEYFSFHHPNIVKLLTASKPDCLNESIVSDVLMVFEFIEGRNLQTVLDDHDMDVEKHDILNYAFQISSALDYVHGFHVAHLDLKPANVMLTLNGVCKLADFGCAQSIKVDPCKPTTRSALTGTFAYRSPELLRGGSPTSKCDVYALGICMWQFWSRQFPYSGMQQHAVIFRVVKSNLRPTFTEEKEIDSAYKELGIQCWSSDPESRPAMKEVIERLKNMTL